MKTLALLSASSLLTAGSLSYGSMELLNKEQVLHMINDKTITTAPLITLNKKLVSNSLSFFVDKDGKLAGQFATKPDNTSQADQGIWAVKSNGALCVTWQSWNDHQPTCAYVYKVGNGVIFINQQTNNFESLALREDIKSGNQIH